MANIFNLVGNVFVETEKAEGAINKITNKGKEADVTLGQKFGNIAKSAVAIGTAVVGAATVVGGGLLAMTNKTVTYTDTIDKMSQRLGMSKQTYQEWDYILGQNGVSIESMNTAMKSMTASMASLAEGGKKGQETLGKLGISLEDLKNLKQEEIFEKAVIALQKMPEGYEKARLSQELFGKQGQEMLPMLNQSKGSIEELKNEAHQLGLIMGDDAVNAGVKLGDSMDALKKSFGAISNNLMASLLPVAQVIVDMLISYMPQISTMFQSMAPILTTVFTNLMPPLIDLAQMLLPTIIDLINMVLPILVEVFEAIMPLAMLFIETFLPPLMDLIKTILPVLMPILRTFASIFSAVLTPAIKILGSVVKGLIDIFKNVFGSLWEIVKAPINWIIGGINKFIEGLNKIKIPDWVPLLGGKGLNIPLIRKLQIGLDYVPSDNYIAALHKGERVLTSEENKQYMKPQQGINANELAKAIRKELSGFAVVLDDQKVGEFIDLRLIKSGV